ncbi:unnamed protein product [Pedinophyceae sp. YPF-701]|nr:unnamed protein product [Pedinophyceae sp. YPF-701]
MDPAKIRALAKLTVIDEQLQRLRAERDAVDSTIDSGIATMRALDLRPEAWGAPVPEETQEEVPPWDDGTDDAWTENRRILGVVNLTGGRSRWDPVKHEQHAVLRGCLKRAVAGVVEAERSTIAARERLERGIRELLKRTYLEPSHWGSVA